MYKNLKEEMVKNNIRVYQIAQLLGIRNATASDKINGKYAFKFNEAVKIKERFFPHISLEVLFECDK